MFLPFAFDTRSRTYLARFSDTLTEQDLTACDAAMRACHFRYGATAGLQDFSGVGEVEISSGQLVSRARRLAIMTGQRRVIVADGMLFGMMRMFAAYQSLHSIEPVILRSLAEACAALGVAIADFRPVMPGAETDSRADATLARELDGLYPLDRAGP